MAKGVLAGKRKRRSEARWPRASVVRGTLVEKFFFMEFHHLRQRPYMHVLNLKSED